MKIDDRVSNYLSLLLDESAKPAPKVKDNAAQSAVPAAGADSVSISPDAVHLGDDEARRERLNAIRQQLSEGSYNISGKDVAEKMLKILKG